MREILKIKKLNVAINDKLIIKDLSLSINQGELVALMGANGAGKSTLVRVLLGDDTYQVKSGQITFFKKDLLSLAPEERAKLGLAFVWQQAPAIKGVELFTLLNLIQEIHDGDYDYQLADSLLFREINANFSGGEKKIAELVQVLNQNPRLLIIDELDSGLDIENLKIVLTALKKELKKKNMALLIISHSGAVLEEIKVQRITILRHGELICQSRDVKKMLNTIKKYGYQKCESCQNCL
ncbi:MAG: ATP-binding cassette domain-containing protein [Patescibacteria group bacterium]|jgi:Fe-S cluster assembly ATP-binding protein